METTLQNIDIRVEVSAIFDKDVLRADNDRARQYVYAFYGLDIRQGNGVIVSPIRAREVAFKARRDGFIASLYGSEVK